MMTNSFRHIPLIAALLLFGSKAAAANDVQEQTDSASFAIKGDTIVRSEQFDPFDYRLQNRYLEKGEPFQRKGWEWFRHLTISGFGGMSAHSNQPTANEGSGANILDRGYNVGAILQYDFTRLHGMRLMFSRTNFNTSLNPHLRPTS